MFDSGAAGSSGIPLPEDGYTQDVVIPKVDGLFAAGKIDDPANLEGSPVWLMAGEDDALVPVELPTMQQELLDHYGAVTELEVWPIIHTFTADMPEQILQHIYSNLDGTGIDDDNRIKVGDVPPRDLPHYRFEEYLDGPEYEEGIFLKFDQWEFVEDVDDDEKAALTNLAEFGWIYYPNTCVEGGCKLVVVLAGAVLRGSDMALPGGGWVSAAHLNDLVVLFPQVYAGGWDATDLVRAAEFTDVWATNDAPQEKALMKMVATLKGDLEAGRDYEADNYFEVHPYVAEKIAVAREADAWTGGVDVLGFPECDDHDDCNEDEDEYCVEYTAEGTYNGKAYDYEWATCATEAASSCDLDGDDQGVYEATDESGGVLRLEADCAPFSVLAQPWFWVVVIGVPVVLIMVIVIACCRHQSRAAQHSKALDKDHVQMAEPVPGTDVSRDISLSNANVNTNTVNIKM